MLQYIIDYVFFWFYELIKPKNIIIRNQILWQEYFFYFQAFIVQIGYGLIDYLKQLEVAKLLSLTWISLKNPSGTIMN